MIERATLKRFAQIDKLVKGSLGQLRESARKLDSDSISARDQFRIPTRAEITLSSSISDPHRPSTYLCGNSLGLLPVATKRIIGEELDIWGKSGVYGHFRHDKDRPWVTIDEVPAQKMAKVVGAQPSEVAVMTTLTTNLHLLMISFYRPTPSRYKIMIERKAFPSDHYMVESQLELHGYKDGMVCIEPDDDLLIPTDTILRTIDAHADSTAVLLLPGVQYYTGQAFEIEKITAYAKQRGIVVGWDLAHAAGNLDLRLHDWNVDFAAWCSYKYLNSGPGGIAGLFVHENQSARPRLTGWWAHNKATRFAMDNMFDRQPGAAGFQLSNPSVLDCVALSASLSVFEQFGMPALRAKSLELTYFLERALLEFFPNQPFRVITPTNPDHRGAQLSLLFKPGLMDKVHEILQQNAVTVDERRPDVIRVAPAPLYNTFEDVYDFVRELSSAIDKAS
ncbi:pyridoxal phosphate-dependent transferase [Lipomyces arxii]|uniref:pyridoxal phosphate-dependent transferase n=1 Tax=Lipomyces arxii TaxID=56418 RepID=UPI0034CD2CC0